MTADDFKVIDAALKRIYELVATLPEAKRRDIALELATIRQLCSQIID